MKKWLTEIYLKYFAYVPRGRMGKGLYIQDGEWKEFRGISEEDIDDILG